MTAHGEIRHLFLAAREDIDSVPMPVWTVDERAVLLAVDDALVGFDWPRELCPDCGQALPDKCTCPSKKKVRGESSVD